MVTPLRGRDELDLAGLERLIEHILAGGVNGLLQDGDVEGVVFELFTAFEQDGRSPQFEGFRMTPAVGFDLGQEPGVVPMDAPVYHHQEFAG